jgi:hypothetical protein
MAKELFAFGFIPSEADPCLFLRQCKDSFTAVLTHVDDMLIVGLSEMVAHTELALSKVFTTTGLGEATFFTGMDIERDRDQLTLKLKQRRYTADTIARFSMSDAKP